MKELSIIIPSFNTKDITFRCLESLYKNVETGHAPSLLSYEIIVVDNASEDGSVEMLRDYQKEHRNVILIENKHNNGYAKANNIGLTAAKGRYILFLNSDVLINNLNFDQLIKFLDQDPKIGALTVKVVLPTGFIDPASHRGFPTIWNALCYYGKLEKIFGRIPLLSNAFGGYHMTYCDFNKIHEIDSPTGAFYLIKRSVLDEVKGFSEDFFMYGEDLDLSFRIRQKGYKIIYYPLFEVTHLKYSSGIKVKNTELQKKTKKHFNEAMKIFYKKHYEKKNFWFVNQLVYALINIKERL